MRFLGKALALPGRQAGARLATIPMRTASSPWASAYVVVLFRNVGRAPECRIEPVDLNTR